MLNYSSLKNIYSRSQPIPPSITNNINLFANQVFMRQICTFVKKVFRQEIYDCDSVLEYKIPIDFKELDNIYNSINKFNLNLYSLPITFSCKLATIEKRKYNMTGGFDIENNDIYVDLEMDIDSIFNEFYKEGNVLRYEEDFKSKLTRDISQIVYHEFVHLIRFSYGFDKGFYKIHNEKKDFGAMKKILHDYESLELEPILSSIHMLVTKLNTFLKNPKENKNFIDTIQIDIMKNINRYKHPRSALLKIFKSRGLKENEINDLINYTLKRLYEIIDMVSNNEIKNNLLNYIRAI